MSDIELELSVGGVVWKGFQSARIDRSLDNLYGEFSLELTRGWPGRSASSVPPIKLGQECRLQMDGRSIVSGFINDVSLTASRDSYQLSVQGRDKASLLMESSVLNKPAEWVGVDALTIIRDICAPFGLAVLSLVDVGAVFAKFTVEPGATAWSAIERVARHRGFFVIAQDGRLILSHPDQAQPAGTDLVFGDGGNVLDASFDATLSGRHSEVIVKNQVSGTNWNTGGHNAITARAVDHGVPHYAPLILIPDEQVDGEQARLLAQRHASLKAGRSSRYNYTLAGWRKGRDMPIWAINETARVRDVMAGVDQTMLIKRVSMSVRDREAPVTTLTVVDPAAYQLTAIPEKAPGGWT